MAWIYRTKSGSLMFSKVKPNKIYVYKFINNQLHVPRESVFTSNKPSNAIIKVYINECEFRISKDTNLYFNLYDEIQHELVKKISKEECVYEGICDMGFSVEFKPETITALKSIVDLENLTVEDGLIEI